MRAIANSGRVKFLTPGARNNPGKSRCPSNGQKRSLTLRLIAGFVITLVCSQALWADYVVTRALRSITGTESERVFLSEVTASLNDVSVGTPVMLNPELPDTRQIWAIGSIKSQNQVIYGAFEPGDANFDDLFVVNLRQPGVARQLNAPRGDPINDFVSLFQTNGEGPRVVYAILDLSTSIQRIYLSDTRVPGRSTLVGELPPGDEIATNFELSPDGSIFAYTVNAASGPRRLAVTFLNRPANSVDIFSDSQLTNYNAAELAFSDDSSLLAWTDVGATNEPGPLRAVTLNGATGTVGPVVLASGSDLVNERVSEFEIKPGSNTQIAYRGFAAGSSLPSDTFLSDLSGAGSVTRLNEGASVGALFTSFEDVLWRGDSVLFNSAENQLQRADLFTVVQDNPGNPTLLTSQVPFATERTNRASGVSHFVLSPNNNRTAMIDGDPALDLFVIDQFNIGASFSPFDITAARSLVGLTDPNEIPPQFSAGSDLVSMVITEQQTMGADHQNLYVASASASNSEVPVLNTESPQVLQYFWLDANAVVTAAPTAMAAAVLPASRSGQVGTTLTAFVTLINGGTVTAESCSIDLIANVPATLSYQTTDPATNAATGTPDTPVDIAPGMAQSFVISIALAGEFAPTDAALAYSCLNADTVAPLAGLNTLLMSASADPVPDVIALAATASGDGIARLDANGNGAFSVASVNVGTGSAISVTADSATDAAIALCESNPVTGACVNPSSPTFGAVELTIDANATPTFSVFASSSETIPLDAANNRVRVVFSDADGNVRGQTSVAVQSQP